MSGCANTVPVPETETVLWYSCLFALQLTIEKSISANDVTLKNLLFMLLLAIKFPQKYEQFFN